MKLEPSAHVDTFARDSLPPMDQWPLLAFNRPELQYPARLNCAKALLDDAIAEGCGDRPAIHHGERTWTYGELAAQANRIAHVLVRDCGLVPGNRVLLRGGNTPELFAAWVGAAKAGAVIVSTMPLLRASELKAIIEKGQVALALCEASLADELVAARNDAPQLKQIMLFGAPDAELEQRAAAKPDRFDAVDTAADDVVLLAFTSGTTGQPKAAAHFHRDVLAMCDTFCRHIVRPRPDDVFTGTPPIAFTFGLGALLAFPLWARAAVALPEKAGPTAKAEAIQRWGVTIAMTSPTAYRALVGQADQFDLSTLRLCVSAGEPLPRATSDAWFERTGLRIVDGIGSTEMIHIFISAAGDAIRPGATGLPVPGYEAALLDDDGAPIEGPGVGRLAVRGPTGCRYLNDPRQRDYVQGGWNVTGDMYRRDADGYYWFEARNDDMIITGGYNVAGPEVEQALLQHPDVLDCAVVAAPDAERGAIIKAFVVVREPAAATDAFAATLKDFVKSRIAPYKYPRAIEFLDALPKTQTGKTQRFRLRQLELERARGAAA
jgi:2-aminobenzoate-CoA ligase